jgi:hypothetical protein
LKIIKHSILVGGGLPNTENWKYTLMNIVATHTATAEVSGIVYPSTMWGGNKCPPSHNAVSPIRRLHNMVLPNTL